MNQRSIALVALLALACSKKDAPAEPEKNPEPADVIAAEDDSPQPTDTPPEPPPKVELLEGGSPPLQTLRREFAKGQTQTINVNIGLNVEIEVDGKANPTSSTPPMFLDVALTVDEVREDGSALITLNVTGAGVGKAEGAPDPRIASLEQALASVVGLQGTYSCDPRGIVTDFEMNAPAGPSPAVRQSIANIEETVRQINVPLPEEAIGKGGRWAVERQFAHAGAQVEERTVFQIEGLKPPRVSVEMSATETAEPQDLKGQQGRTAKLRSLAAESKGSATWSLNALAPSALENNSNMTMSMTATAGTITRDISAKTQQRLAIESD